MTIKDRGLIKWNAASFLPEQGAMMRRMWAEQEHQEKPLVDQFVLAEIEERVNYAMEYNLTVSFRVWNDGVENVVIGEVHYVDMKRRCYNVDTDAGWWRVKFDDVVGVDVED
jgi:hypothetical protein